MTTVLGTLEQWQIVRHFMPVDGATDPVSVVSVSLDDHGFIATDLFEDGRQWGVQPLAFGRALLGVWRSDAVTLSHDDQWEYQNHAVAILAAVLWGGIAIEPSWWVSHPASGRRVRYERGPAGAVLVHTEVAEG